MSLFHSSSHSPTRHRQSSPSFDIIIYIIIHLPTAVRFSCFQFSDRQCRRVRARWKMPITILLLIMTENKIENMTTTRRLLHMRDVHAQTRRIRLIIVGGSGGHIIVRGGRWAADIVYCPLVDRLERDELDPVVVIVVVVGFWLQLSVLTQRINSDGSRSVRRIYNIIRYCELYI